MTHTEDFRRGATLFDAERYFDAHEAWEDLWRQLNGDEKRFLQSLIQFAVAMHHFRRGNLAGARSLIGRSYEALERMSDSFFQVDRTDLLVTMEQWRAAANLFADCPPERPVIPFLLEG